MVTAAQMPSPPATLPLEELSELDEVTECKPVESKGGKLLRAFVLEWMPRVYDAGITRACEPGHGVSDHNEGRAWDAGCSIADGEELVDYLLRPDELGRPFANARRLGVQYLIHNRRMWRAYEWPPLGLPAGAWSAYHGPSPHTDHVHISLSRWGSKGEASFYHWLESGAVGPSGSSPPSGGGPLLVAGILLVSAGVSLAAWHALS